MNELLLKLRRSDYKRYLRDGNLAATCVEVKRISFGKDVAPAASFFLHTREVIYYRYNTNHSNAHNKRKDNRTEPFGEN